jgi:ectoine hydroxylase-related dioxygenase (phytanoyl-CoA dioxygenase family)
LATDWSGGFEVTEEGFENDSEIFTAWVALSDVKASSGPMNLIRGSHTWANGMLQLPGWFHDQQLVQQQETALATDGAGESWQAVPAILPAGGVSVHDWRTLHGSGPNHDSTMRCSLAIHMRAVRSYPRSNSVGENYLDQFLHDRRRHCCPVILGDPLGGTKKVPPIYEAARL